MYQDIELSSNWREVTKIDKGWSSDQKYYVQTHNGEQLLLRLSDISTFEAKQKEYDIICKYVSLGFEMSQPIAFGTCNNQQTVYMLLTWIEGEDLQDALPKLSKKQQYELGKQAGTILKQIHTLEVDEADIPSQTKLPKKIDQINRYMNSTIRVENDEIALSYISQNINKMWKMKPTYLHGDFHPGNLILTPRGEIGVIDFNRWEVGDPYEEFYKLESFGVEVSVPYCIGQIDAYFNDNVPTEFWETLTVYVAHASLFSIKWAEKFSQSDIEGMVARWEQAFKHYEQFNEIIPTWYAKR